MSCGVELAPGQWWRFCGETDMGQTMPALCINCGGSLQPKPSPLEQWLEFDQRAKVLYTQHTDNDPVVHCNRFPAWEELDEATKDIWRIKAISEPR